MLNQSSAVFLFSLVLVLTVAGCGHSGTGTNPEIEEEIENEIHPLDPGIEDDYSDISHIDNFPLWGPYNVHDPTIIKHEDWYYIYSTDVFFGGGDVPDDDPRKDPKIPIRRSQDLVQWEPIGHVFDEMPEEVVTFLREQQSSYEPLSVWAPYIVKVDDHYRLYYSVPANDGLHTAWLGFATSSHPEGPWINEGMVLPTLDEYEYNGIDPAVTIDQINGRHWLIYGSWENGISTVELDPETGFRLDDEDAGEVIVSRNLDSHGNIAMEGAEVIYQPEYDKYYLFVSYDWLMEPYNIRVGRADQPQGPYFDMFGNNLADQSDNYPKISAQYRFNNHPGWQGVGHAGLLRDEENYYLVSQGRLGGPFPNEHFMVMHLRKMVWTNDGWPTVSPQRYAAIPQDEILMDDIPGRWEHITLNETLNKNDSESIALSEDGSIEGYENGSWSLTGTNISIQTDQGDSFDAQLMWGWDWENSRVTLLFTGLNDEGISEWGKKAE